MYNLSLTACSFHLKVKNSKSVDKIYALNKQIRINKADDPITFQNAKELFELFFQAHGEMMEDPSRKMTFSCDYETLKVINQPQFVVLRAKINSGIYGSSADIIDRETMQIKWSKTVTDIELRPFYLYIILPKDSDTVSVNKGMFLFQNEGVYGIKTITTDNMQKFFTQNFGISLICRTISHDLFFRKIVTQESLKKVILIKNHTSYDRADNGRFGYGKEVRTIANLTFGTDSWQSIQNKFFSFMGNRYSLFEFEGTEYDSLKLNVSIGGRERTIDLHNLEHLSIIEGIPDDVQMADGHPNLAKLDQHMIQVAGEYLSEMALEIH